MSGFGSFKFKLDMKGNQRVSHIIATCGKKAVFVACDVLAAASKEQVPLDEGTLKNSCYVDAADTDGTVSYDTPYAVIQHENLSFNHQRGRKAKYLEDPCNDPGVQADMLAAMEKVYRGEL